MVSTWDSPCNDPGSIPGSGGAAWIWACYPCGSAATARWDVKPRSGICMHAFKIMRGPKRTWMTKRKSKGPETYRYGRHINPTMAEWSWLHTRHLRLLKSLSVQCRNLRANRLTRNPNKGIEKKKKNYLSGCLSSIERVMPVTCWSTARLQAASTTDLTSTKKRSARNCQHMESAINFWFTLCL